jgi:hypothetical protein
MGHYWTGYLDLMQRYVGARKIHVWILLIIELCIIRIKNIHTTSSTQDLGLYGIAQLLGINI